MTNDERNPNHQIRMTLLQSSRNSIRIWSFGFLSSLVIRHSDFFPSLSIVIRVCFLLTLSLRTLAADWPQFLGPTRNGVYTGTELAQTWPKEGPPVVWQMKVGQGFSGPVVAEGKLILFHRLEDKETIQCLDSKTGKLLWSFDYPTAYRDDFGFDEGPRATPAIADGRAYTYGAEGVLTCLEIATGKRLWSIDCKKDFHAPKGFFGIACS